MKELAEEVAVIEAEGDQFGGGNLQNYFGIRSNTSAVGFLKVIQYPKQQITALSSAKKNDKVGPNLLLSGSRVAKEDNARLSRVDDPDGDPNAKIMP